MPMQNDRIQYLTIIKIGTLFFYSIVCLKSFVGHIILNYSLIISIQATKLEIFDIHSK